MSNKNVITFVVLALVGAILGGVLILNNNPGTVAEIVEVSPADATTGSVVLCTPSGQGLGGAAGLERFVAQLSPRTEILDQRKTSPANLRVLDLAVGQRVRVWTDGSIMKSQPPQVLATRLIVLQNGKAGESLCEKQ